MTGTGFIGDVSPELERIWAAAWLQERRAGVWGDQGRLSWAWLKSDFGFREEVARSLHGPANLCWAAHRLFFAPTFLLVVSEGFLFCPEILQRTGRIGLKELNQSALADMKSISCICKIHCDSFVWKMPDTVLEDEWWRHRADVLLGCVWLVLFHR